MDRNNNLLQGEIFHQTVISSVTLWADLQKTAVKYLQRDVGMETVLHWKTKNH